nr:hypothetical protein [Tanacetum cinerariifolium]
LPNVEITSLLIMNVFVVQMSLPIIVKNTWTMATTIEQQVTLDEALVPSTQSLCPSTFYPIQDEQQETHYGSGIIQGDASYLTLTNVNINKLYQSWRPFAAIINKCLTGKSSGYDSFRLSQAQILWGLYHTRSIDYAFLIWEDFVYQVENKNQKKSNEMYYPRFTKVVSRHQNTQQYGAMLPIELTNDEIKNTKAYKEYYAFATGEAAPKPKASARRKRSGSDTYITPPTATTTPTTTVVVTPKLTAAVKGKQPAKAKCLSDPSEVARTEAQQLKIVLRRSRQQTHISQPGGSGIDEGTSSKPGVSDVPTDESEEELS